MIMRSESLHFHAAIYRSSSFFLTTYGNFSFVIFWKASYSVKCSSDTTLLFFSSLLCFIISFIVLYNVDTNDDGDDGNNHDGLDKAMIFISPLFLLRILSVYFCCSFLLPFSSYLTWCFLLLSMWRFLLQSDRGDRVTRMASPLQREIPLYVACCRWFQRENCASFQHLRFGGG